MSKLTKSIELRFILLFALIVTVLLGAFGTYVVIEEQRQGEAQLADLANAMQVRMQAGLPTLLWNMDYEIAGALLDSEVIAADVSAIVVRKSDKVLVARSNDGGKAVPLKETATPAGEKYSAELTYSGKPAGTVDIYISRARAEKAQANAIVTALVEVVVLNAVIILVLITMLRSVVLRPLRRVRDALHEIATGRADLTRRLHVSREDEIGEVAMLFNRFVENLQGIVRQVVDGAHHLQTSSSSMSEESDDMAHRTARENDAIAAIAAATEEMTVSINHIARFSGDVREVSSRSEQLSSRGREVIVELIAGMGVVSDTVVNASRTVESLGEESEKIGAVIGVIKEIADQTNLLALNAAIEAARAGDQGRGFAVVADEVRKLAERTTRSTVEIGETIGVVQNGVLASVERMRGGVDLVRQVLDCARQAEGAIQDIAKSSGELSSAVSEIVSSIEEQNSASTEVAQQIEDISRIAEESGTTMKRVVGTAVQVSTLSAQLKSAVGGFTI
ncbi:MULTISPECIES: methyl-accepting chemotaxis protein [unclassified Uliginosibacterium]|uniref:methyl-accepting chemotaxis protein n=1 Tax=unclassified Uliginosibacterium TaxID=2621521 RepID=UPI000C7DD507|nr:MULTISPECIES: methyl-accepting chemotaxis protein [unclassified Uliginosibacterium]MDO6387862.1 methyl-accepting chemotaxis protein [Uliginosibacterium sp. 31-12]PLK48965.1 hypothetical protein C0V76_07070 [Uliginosibacterium sp. TH139]